MNNPLETRQARMRDRQRIARIRAKGGRPLSGKPVILPRTWLEQVMEYQEPRRGRPIGKPIAYKTA